jgi:hypothetical protein
MRYLTLLALVALLASCASQGPSLPTASQVGIRVLQWEAREACTAVYVPAQETGVYLAAIRCP